jgi:DnaJ-class molecular chaperone
MKTENGKRKTLCKTCRGVGRIRVKPEDVSKRTCKDCGGAGIARDPAPQPAAKGA